MTTPLFSFTPPPGFPSHRLYHFEGAEQVSGDTAFHLSLKTQIPLDMDTWLGQPLSLKLALPQQTPRYFQGLIQEIYKYSPHTDGFAARLTFEPPIQHVNFTPERRIFLEPTLAQLITTLCQENGIPFDSHIPHRTFTQPVVQYEETLYEFLQRLLAREKVFFYHRYTETQAILTFSDKDAPPNHMIRPDHYEELEAVFSVHGDVFRFKTRLARQLQDTFQLPDGMPVRVDSLEHQLDPNYCNTVKLLPLTEPHLFPETRAFAPLQFAELKAWSETAPLATIVFPWSPIPVHNVPCRQRASYSQHLPQVGETVLIDFFEGDPERPLIMGLIPERQFGFTQTGFHTEAGHLLSLDDLPGHEDIQLHSTGDLVLETQRLQHTHDESELTVQAETLIDILRGQAQIQVDNLILDGGGSQICFNDQGIQFHTPQLTMRTQTQNPQQSSAPSHTQQADRETLDPREFHGLPPLPIVQYLLQFQVFTEAAHRFRSVVPIEAPNKPLPPYPLGTQQVAEVISLGGKPISPPRIEIHPEPLTPITHSTSQRYTPGLPHLTVGYLHPPILVQNDEPLSSNILEYYHTQNALVPIFIHGYDVEPGQFAEHWQKASLFQGKLQLETYPAFCTYLRDKHLAQTLFPEVAQFFPPDDTCDNNQSPYNGSGAHLWLLWMEDNLNRATNQFKRGPISTWDYTHYLRTIGFFWDWGGNRFDFNQSEAKAEQAAPRLVKLLKQLLDAGLCPIPIAHSLGARVLLRALDILGQENFKKLEHAFLFQPAVANTALSPNPPTDEPGPVTHHFIYAMDAVEKMTVFHSLNDTAALLMGYGGNEVLNQTSSLLSAYGLSNAAIYSSANPETQRMLFERAKALSGKKVVEALGYSGPDLADKRVSQLYAEGRIVIADMTRWSKGHSYMKVPGSVDDLKSVMVRAYQQYLFNRDLSGLKKFGLYDPSQFREFDKEGNPK